MGQKFFIQPGEISKNDVKECQETEIQPIFFRGAISFYSILHVPTLCRNASLDSSRHTLEKVLNLGKRDGGQFLSADLFSRSTVLGDLFSTRRLMMLLRFLMTGRSALFAGQSSTDGTLSARHARLFFALGQKLLQFDQHFLASSKMNFRRCHEYLK